MIMFWFIQLIEYHFLAIQTTEKANLYFMSQICQKQSNFNKTTKNLQHNFDSFLIIQIFIDI